MQPRAQLPDRVVVLVRDCGALFTLLVVAVERLVDQGGVGGVQRRVAVAGQPGGAGRRAAGRAVRRRAGAARRRRAVRWRWGRYEIVDDLPGVREPPSPRDKHSLYYVRHPPADYLDEALCRTSAHAHALQPVRACRRARQPAPRPREPTPPRHHRTHDRRQDAGRRPSAGRAVAEKPHHPRAPPRPVPALCTGHAPVTGTSSVTSHERSTHMSEASPASAMNHYKVAFNGPTRTNTCCSFACPSPTAAL